ncbi:MAG: glycosyltransferase [Acidobacteria bacterium]|nr:glycosyltransferase [Acidobacteriota bacterium]
MTSCWCGHDALVHWNEDYARCPACESLVCIRGLEARVEDDRRDFYGEDYWFGHQAALGLPDIWSRAATDLVDRIPRWLQIVLRYAQPPARTLELGCAHGGFVATLSAAGFDASGLELSPAIAAVARQAFGIDVLIGPLEAQAIPAASVDVLVAMDVLEHLPDPVGTMRAAAGVLSPAGVMVLQTPRYEEGATYDALRAAGAPFLSMLLPGEHLFLFSRRAVRELLARVGIGHVTFEPAVFARYDMCLVAASQPLTALPAMALSGSAPARIVQSVIDLDEARRSSLDRLTSVEADAAARLTQIDQLHVWLAEARAQRDATTALVAERDADVARAALESRQLVGLLEQARIDLARADLQTSSAASSSASAADAHAPLIAIDVTPILPGSENGGAKGFVLSLLDILAGAHAHRYLLLTSQANHESFAAYETIGMRRLCVDTRAPDPMDRFGRAGRWLARGLRRVRVAAGHGRLVSEGVRLLFCPMTDPLRAEPGVPVVSLLYDLQHLTYPMFFTAEELANRQAFYARVQRSADAVVCISEFTRQDAIARLHIAPERTFVAPVVVHGRLPDIQPDDVVRVRERYGLGTAPYAIFPANGWPHKNHRVLFVAFARLWRDRPDCDLRLVLPGNLLDAEADLRLAIDAMGLGSRVHILGYVPEADLGALWFDAFCLVYPSLFEGFGIPLLEAMRYGVPVVCSNVTSLPEVAGDAALLVDPRRPAAIAAAVADLIDMPDLRFRLIAAGRRRIREFSAQQMGKSYVAIFEHLLHER